MTDQLNPPTAVDFANAAWAETPAPGEAVVARVDGTPITVGTLRALIAAHPDRSPRELLDRLIELEVLARAAYASGLGAAEDAVYAWRQALVQAYLHREFEPRYSPSDISMEEVRRIYRIPSIRQIYDHAPAWRAAHAKIDCCNPRAGQACGQDDRPVAAAVVRCFADAAYLADEVYRDLERDLGARERSDADELLAALTEYYERVLRGRYGGRVTFEPLRFYYDPAKSHAEQKGYAITAEPVARAVIDAETGVFIPPVESRFGWHVLIKLDHVPEERRGPDDPEVAADIRKHAFPKWQQARFRHDLDALLESYHVAVRPEPLELLSEAASGRDAP